MALATEVYVGQLVVPWWPMMTSTAILLCQSTVVWRYHLLSHSALAQKGSDCSWIPVMGRRSVVLQIPTTPCHRSLYRLRLQGCGCLKKTRLPKDVDERVGMPQQCWRAPQHEEPEKAWQNPRVQQ